MAESVGMMAVSALRPTADRISTVPTRISAMASRTHTMMTSTRVPRLMRFFGGCAAGRSLASDTDVPPRFRIFF